MWAWKYQKIVADEDEEATGLLMYEDSSRTVTSFILAPYPWMVSTLLLLSVILLRMVRDGSSAHNTYARGFRTEFDLALSAIEMKEVRFSGSLKYTDEGRLYIDYGTDEPRYFGEPSPEIDQAWQDLIGPYMVVVVDDEEANKFDPAPFKHPLDGTSIGPDVLHSLHCVNNVRMILDSEYYLNRTLTELKKVQRLHLEHCLNHIRQLIQCHMDITPIPSMYVPVVNTAVGNFDQVHTCRDLGKLREWVVKQYESKGLNQPSENHGSNVTDPGIPTHGYVLNDDARLPWAEAHDILGR